MNLSSIPHWLSPGWLALYAFVFLCFYLYGRALTEKRREEACREAERHWPEVRGTVFSLANDSLLPQIVVDVPRGPQRGRYRASVTAEQRDRLQIGQELICRVGRHPKDRASDPLRCVFSQAL